MEITEEVEEEDQGTGLLSSSQRVQLYVLLESSKELLSQGALCPKLLWQEYRRDQRWPRLEVVYHLHVCNILSLKHILESDEGVRLWLVSQLKALCRSTPPPQEEEEEGEVIQVQKKVLSTVVGVLVGSSFELSSESAAADKKKISVLCCSVLDDMLYWLLDMVEANLKLQSAEAEAQQWIQTFDASLCGVSVSAEALQRFFTHSLTLTLTYKPQLTVSDAITLQNKWIFATASRLMTSLFRKLAVIFSVEQLLRHLQQVLETHEVNWRNVLCFLSTLLVYNPRAQPSLRELLSGLLTTAFECYDLESMITAFLLARQGALEGPAIFPSYSDWFKMSFGGGSGYHATSKKSLVFLLKFLSDLVPYEPPQYLKVHILHPPYVPVKHRSLLMEYISLAKTRLADLKESVEDMGLYEEVSGAAGPSVQCQAVQDVEKALSLFESTGRISAAVMEASIFRRPYFLTRFLPALLTPRVLPVKADTRMTFIEALKKADKIPAAQYSSYVEACQKQRQHDCGSTVCLDSNDDSVEVLKIQLQEFTELLSGGNDGDMSAQLSRISHTLSVIFPGRDELMGQSVIKLDVNTRPSSELHVKAVNMILRNFCQCTLNASHSNPPSKQNMWASWFVSVLIGNTQLLRTLMHRLWDLFRNQGSSLSAAHLLGLAALLVQLHASMSTGPLVQLEPAILPQPVSVVEALSSALVCRSHADMIFCVRLCVAAVCYGMCRGDSAAQQQEQDFIVPSLYKKLFYLIPRLLPEARGAPDFSGGPLGGDQEQKPSLDLWKCATEGNSTWRTTAWQLWRNPAFQQHGHTAQSQLTLTEWLAHELRVQRSEDALSDPERHEYQQWACLELYLNLPEEQGGCGGDMRRLLSHLLNAIMDQHLRDQSMETLDPGVSGTGTCLPDLMSRVQELVYELEVTELSGSRSDVHDFLFEFVSERCSAATTALNISGQLSLQHTLNTWNRLLLALPAGLFTKVKADGGRTTLVCDQLIEHVNCHQRRVCSPAGLLSCRLTAHFLRGIFCSSARCGRSAEEVNRTWSQISLCCPLLLVSAMHWWDRLFPLLSSLWCRLSHGEPLPEQLQLLTACQSWAFSLESGVSLSSVPAAAALLLAAGLHRAWLSCASSSQFFSAALKTLQRETRVESKQVLVFLLFLCVNDYLSSVLYPQEKCRQRAVEFCRELLSVLLDSADWLLIFKPNEQGVYQSVTMVTSEEFTQLMPWAFYSLLLQQSEELQHRAACCPGFLHTAVLCYISLLQLLLDGRTPPTSPEPSQNQVDPFQTVSCSKQLLLAAISQASPSALSSAQLRQLESQCAEVDPDVAAALSVHLNPHSCSPEMDFL
ncbi:uncharacterized protein V6R79_019071 [Siganus canaliculatus]